ncbi:MAG: Universal stress protein family protein, partial [Chlorobi bacterium OLB7]
MNVLLAFDGSKSSVAALHDLATAGLDADTRFLVVTVAEVWHPLEPESLEQEPLPEFIPTGLRSLHERSSRELSRAFQIADEGADLLRNSFPAATINAQAYADSPSLGILAQAEEWRAEMIVVGAQGRSMLGAIAAGKRLAQSVGRGALPGADRA